MKTCFFVDWLELYGVLSAPQVFDNPPAVYSITWRGYGSKVWGKVATITAPGGAVLECRYAPRSVDAVGGLLPAGACMWRVCNGSLYCADYLPALFEALTAFGVEKVQFHRLDLCADFTRTAGGSDVAGFLYHLMTGDVQRKGARRASFFCERTGEKMRVSGVTWGTAQSKVKTRVYNKTKELTEEKEKPYIRRCWHRAGYREHEGAVYRAEIEIHADGFTVRSSPSARPYVITPESLVPEGSVRLLFLQLARHYFSFYIKDGSQRAARCEPYILIDTDGITPLCPVSSPSLDELYTGAIAAERAIERLCFLTKTPTSCEAVAALLSFARKTASVCVGGWGTVQEERRRLAATRLAGKMSPALFVEDYED